jgi:hypothetical protein
MKGNHMKNRNVLSFTHYWTLVNLCNPPGVHLKDKSGFYYGNVERDGTVINLETSYEPSPIHGVNPNNVREPMDFGDWQETKDIFNLRFFKE